MSNHSSPPTVTRQTSSTTTTTTSTGVVAFEATSPQLQHQMSLSSASHSIVPEKFLPAATFSPKTVPRNMGVEDRTTYTIPKKQATDRYLSTLLTRTRGY